MHKAKTPKLLTSIFAVFALIFGGLVVSGAPASAADDSPSGCQTSGWTPSKCGGKTVIAAAANVDTVKDLTVTETVTREVLSVSQLACSTSGGVTPTPTYKLFAVADTAYVTPITSINFDTPSTSVIRFSETTARFEYIPSDVKTLTRYVIVKNCNGYYTRYSMYVQVLGSLGPAIMPAYQEFETTLGQDLADYASYEVVRFTGTPTFSIEAGDPVLPASLTLESTTGVIRGKYTGTATEITFRITATYAASSEVARADVKLIFSSVTAESTGDGGGGGAAEPSRKVTICHRTHAVTNPYVRITVDYNSVNKKSGHQIHDEIFAGEHVFKAGIYKRAKDKDWGDIIPADPSGLNRWKPLNWTPLGAQIYNGTVEGCPAFDAVKYYNALREAGVPEKKIKQEIGEIETEQAEAEPSTKKSNVSEIKYTGSNKNIAEEDNDKVTLCHRTNSVTNPYVRITVAASSVYKNAGHYGHDEIYDGHHVFDSSVTYPNNKKDWGDIIPADPTGKNRWAALNMTALGKQIFDGTVEGCAEKSLQTLYNELREEGKSKKEILADLEKEKNTDVDPKDLDELEYTGNDPETEKTEPKEPVEPANVKIPDQSLSGIVWLDINKDGLKDPDEPLMKGIKLYVVQLTSVPAPITPATVNATVRRATVPVTDAPVKAAAVVSVQTDANGFYLFPSLGAGDWKVTTTVPNDLYVTYDSHESSDGEIVATVPVASHAFTWVGLVGETEKVTLAKITEILKENPNALPLAEVPPALKTLVKQAKAIIAAGKTPVYTANGLAYTGTNDLAILFFGVLLMLSGLLLRLVRTKR